jgi:TRAP-type C4-dicarboxylate transport system permease small subunit
MLQLVKRYAIKFLEISTALILFLMIFFVFAGIIARYILKHPLVWGEEIALIGQIWLTFMGASLLCATGEHMVVDVILNYLSEKRKLVLAVINQIFVIPLFIAFIFGGMKVVNITSKSITPGLGVSVSIMYIPAVAGGILMFFFSVELLVSAIKEFGKFKSLKTRGE